MSNVTVMYNKYAVRFAAIRRRRVRRRRRRRRRERPGRYELCSKQFLS